jgi:hypothetical protein
MRCSSVKVYDPRSDIPVPRLLALVPVVPKLKHALASIQSAPGIEKISLCRKDAPLRPMLRFVARGLIARQNDLCRVDIEAARK